MSKTNIVTTIGGSINFGDMHEGEQRVVKKVHEMRDASKMIGADPICGAFVYGSDGRGFGAAGNADAHPIITALEDARMAGATVKSIAVSVPDNRVHNPLPADVLDALADFDGMKVLLVGDDRSVVIGEVRTSIAA